MNYRTFTKWTWTVFSFECSRNSSWFAFIVHLISFVGNDIWRFWIYFQKL